MPDDRFQRPVPRQRERHKSVRSGFPLIAVQSISCVVVILIALVIRFAGGEAFEQLRQSFSDSLMNNSLMATLSALVEGSSGEGNGGESSTETSDDTSGASDAKTEPSGTDDAGETTAVDTEGTAAPMGGQDLAVTEKKTFYAPEGATFAPLKVNTAPARPLASGTVTSYFGYRENPTQGGESFHQGLDIAADAGQSDCRFDFRCGDRDRGKRQLWSLYQNQSWRRPGGFVCPLLPDTGGQGRRAAGRGDGGPGGKHRGFYRQSPTHRGAFERSRLRSG